MKLMNNIDNTAANEEVSGIKVLPTAPRKRASRQAEIDALNGELAAERAHAWNLSEKLTSLEAELSSTGAENARLKTAARKRAADAVKPEPGVVGQVRAALKPANRLATALGFLLGGFVPLATYFVAHHVTAAGPWMQPCLYLAIGGLLYSVKTVHAWGRTAFGCPVKAAGFVILLEGTMTVSGIGWLSTAALCYLVAINGVASGCKLSKGK
jgi:hypothetical protein